MSELGVREALRGVGIEPARVTPIGGGWAYWTFDLDGAAIARFPRDAGIARAADRELRLLPELGRGVSFRVPAPTHRGSLDGWTFFVYPRIPGRPLAASDRSPGVLQRVSEMLRELHAFSAHRAAELLGTEATVQGWRRYYEDLWPAVRDEALPALDTALAGDVERAYGDFVRGELSFPCRLVHFDLGPSHVLIDEADGLPTGIIDFESAWVGDPVVDYLWLGRELAGSGWRDLAGDLDLGRGVERRAWFYTWMGAIHAVIHGVREHDADEIAVAVAGVRQRFEARPCICRS